ncbi:hypothetical protein H5410_019212 [Solanum commersonii]|uniref:Uncharacterized protein n=1 Tax=Solanum commersonii TaxID=4109 RepID=A0A9J6A5B9_SOLCO|nr:hypothetical protein H5410_019212 [Solanum commersonii]
MVIGNLTTVVQVKQSPQISRRRYTRTEEGNLGCLPGLRMLNPPTKNGCLEEAELHNLLLGMLKELKYSLYDFNRSLRQRMNHPSRYGREKSRGGKRPVKQLKAQKGMPFGILTQTIYQQMADAPQGQDSLSMRFDYTVLEVFNIKYGLSIEGVIIYPNYAPREQSFELSDP